MNFLQRLVLGKKLARQLEEKAFKQPQRFEIQNGVIVSHPDNKQSYIDNGYAINDIVYSVVQVILDKVRVAPWALYKVVDDSSLKSYKALINNKNISARDYKKALQFRKKAMEPINNFNLQMGKLNDLLKYPNEKETWSDFVVYGCLFKLITGDKFVAADILKGGANQGIPNSLYNLPSQLVNIIASRDFPSSALGYKLFVFNQDYSTQEILHEIYPTLQWTINGFELYGTSPLKAAIQGVLSRNNSAIKSSIGKFQNGGIETVLYMDDPRYDAAEGLEQAQALKIKLANEYSGETNQGKLAVSGVKVGAVPLGLSPVELGIIESEKWDLARICNIYGVPSQMLNDDKASRNYNNTKEAEKALTNRSALPLLTAFRDQFNRKIQSDWGFKGKNVYVDFDMTIYGELTENIKDALDGTSDLILLTPNEQREIGGLDTRPEPEADELWVKQGTGWVPLSDFQANVVDQALNQNLNGQQNGNGQANGQTGNNGTGNGKAGTKGIPVAKELLS